MIEQINRNAAAQKEQLERWEREMGLAPLKRQEREPTELELLLQEWEQARVAPQSPEPEGEELPPPEPEGEEPSLPKPRGEEPPLPEPRGEEPPLPEPRGEEPPLPEPRGEEAKSPPPPQPRPPLLLSSPAPLRAVPRPSLLDTLPVGLDLPSLDLEPRSRQNRSQFSTWFPAPLLPNTKTSLRCSQMSLTLPLVTASLPWVIGRCCTGSQLQPSARCCSLQCPGCRSGRP
ncbi:UNVERIFIED_CONTAM: hypothetical protein FKN15_040260 [Acipenser sinensis]